jgi:hypothetical protein
LVGEGWGDRVCVDTVNYFTASEMLIYSTRVSSNLALASGASPPPSARLSTAPTSTLLSIWTWIDRSTPAQLSTPLILILSHSYSSDLFKNLEDLRYAALVDALYVVEVPLLAVVAGLGFYSLLACLVGGERGGALGLAHLGHGGVGANGLFFLWLWHNVRRRWCIQS